MTHHTMSERSTSELRPTQEAYKTFLTILIFKDMGGTQAHSPHQQVYHEDVFGARFGSL